MVTLSVEPSGPGTVVLRLERPERLNAINEVMVRELHEACDRIAGDRDVRVVVLTGAGRGFCSGIDMRDFGPAMLEPTDPAIDRLRFQEKMAALPKAIRELPQPVIAAVNGPAVGGGLALCLAADVRLCSASASFGNAADPHRPQRGRNGDELPPAADRRHQRGRRLDAHGADRDGRGGPPARSGQ